MDDVYPIETEHKTYLGDEYLVATVECHEYHFPPEMFESVDLWNHEFTEYSIWQEIYKATGSNRHELGVKMNGKEHWTTVSHVMSAIATIGRIGHVDYPAFHPEVCATFELMFSPRFRRNNVRSA